MSVTEVAWVAGIMEGEGYFYVGQRTAKDGSLYPIFNLRLNMTDRDIVDRFAAVVGMGTVRGPLPVQEAHHKPAYSWSICQRNEVACFCRAVLPWMGERRGARIGQILSAYEASEPKPPEHGTRPSYTAGCRCDACRAVNNKRQRAYYAVNHDRFAGYRAKLRAARQSCV